MSVPFLRPADFYTTGFCLTLLFFFVLLLSLKDLYDPVREGGRGGAHLLKIKAALSQNISSVFYPDSVILKHSRGKYIEIVVKLRIEILPNKLNAGIMCRINSHAP